MDLLSDLASGLEDGSLEDPPWDLPYLMTPEGSPFLFGRCCMVDILVGNCGENCGNIGNVEDIVGIWRYLGDAFGCGYSLKM